MTFVTSKTRVLLGFIFAPLVPQLFLALGSHAGHYGRGVVIGIIVACYLLMLLCGVPTHFFLRSRGRVTRWDYMVTGAAAGAIFSTSCCVIGQILILLVGHGSGLPLGGVVAVAIVFALFMAPVMGGFWWIARPDQTGRQF